MKQLDVQIMGQSYLLSCPEEAQDQLMAAVHKVHEAMCKIQDAGKIKARERIAVLAALNLAYETPPVPSQAITSAASENPNAGLTTNENTTRQIEALLNRIDHALNLDGQLI